MRIAPRADAEDRAELLIELERRQREIERLGAELAAWEATAEGTPARLPSFTSVSGNEIEPLYTPGHLWGGQPAGDYLDKLGFPGGFPYTRGPYATMYRTRLWTMRQFAGFATAEATNERYKYLLDHGQTGLSVAFDFPTLMGYDGDHPRSLGEVGVCGVAVSSLEDMETLFDGIPLDEVSVSMTINGPAIILFCFYVAAAERQGISPDRLRGTVQNDILKEYQGAARLGLSARARAAAHPGHVRVVLRARAPLQPRVDLGLSHPRGGRHGGPGARLHPGQRLRVRQAAGSSAASTWTRSPPGFRSSSTFTTTSSKRSPSSERPAASGRAGCATSSERATRSRGAFAPTPRRRASP